MIQSCVAVPTKAYGYSLRAAPGLQSSGALCIPNYQMDGLLVGTLIVGTLIFFQAENL